MSLAKKISFGILTILVLLLGALAYLIGTTSGLHLLLKGATRWVPGLEIASVNGGWRDLTLRDVRYQLPGMTVKAGRLHLALDLSCFRQRELCVNDLALSQVDVAVDTAALASAPAAPPAGTDDNASISTPYPLIMRNLSVNGLRVQIDHTVVALDQFRTGMDFRGNTLIVTPTDINGLLVALPKTVAVITDQAIDAVVQTDEQKRAAATRAEAEKAAARRQPPLAETLTALFAKPLLPDLPDIHLPLNIQVQELRGADLRLTGDTDIQVKRFLMQVQTLDRDVTLARLRIDAVQGLLNASGKAQLGGQWPLDFTVNTQLNVDPLKGERIKLTIKGSLRERLDTVLNFSGPIKAQLNVAARLAENGLPLAVTFDSPGMQWPLAGAPQYRLRDLGLKVDGKAVDYTLAMHGAVGGEGLPPADLSLEGKGNPTQFILSRLRVAALEGNTDLTAVIDWSDAVSWRSELTLSGINTAKQWPDWPARLAGKISTQGSIHGGSWQLRIPELTLDGNIRQNQVTARGSLSGNAAGQWHIPDLRLALGRNSLDVKGDLNQQLALDAVLDAPSLNGTLPGLAGTARGTLAVRGDRETPQVNMDLTAAGLRWQSLTIRRIALTGHLRASDIVRGDLDLRLDQLRQDSLVVRQLTLAATGDERRHQMRLVVQGEPVSGQLTLNGGYDRQTQRWRGALAQTRFGSPVGEWRLTRDMSLDYQHSAQRIAIGPHCWQNPNAQLCVPTTIEAGASGQAGVALNRFDLAMLKPFLPADTALSGIFTGRADVSWQPGGGLPQARITLAGKGVKVVQNVQGNALPVAFETLNLNAGLDHDRARLDWQMGIAGNGRFNGQVVVADPQGRRTLSGTLSINRLSLAIVNPILSRGESVAGILNASLRVGGSVAQPQLFGQLALDKVLMRGNRMPFVMGESRLAMAFNGASSTLQGVIQTTHGQINLGGNADWSQINAWRARIAAQGARVRITVPPMVRMDVSPDIVLEAAPQVFTLNGRVDIPWARIVVKELPPSAVGVSPDEVILDNRLQPVEPAKVATVINSNLIIHVGSDVRLDAFGLRARLEGDLKMVQDKQGLGLNGQINIPYGRFRAYGQDLIVRRGQLMFAGPPDQPLLNVEAIRNPDNTADSVIAGVRVTGMADQPRLEVFSEPVKSQQEALSYLLRGQGLNTPGADSSAMTSMLIGMGVAQSGQLVGKIGSAFGVSNLTLDTQGVGDESQVVVSGYVAPGLQVKYGVGIFDSLATLTLRYRLMPRLYLEAVSGLDQALDLLYQFEF
ncbi:autotransporter assembly complex protein TamB [Acerihabitans arboris]|uniref:Translocation and assembly module TamB n=1 Tax=Acerihabitans arboris TaxID=2691583 RepID=A0A845SFL2_9GAMM|nr:translocation/assembly module TamB domain-containing protein [Acerihabitans arboris]NDL61421.1 translocation and assembly module TamB [Acerihabitans arboris]